MCTWTLRPTLRQLGCGPQGSPKKKTGIYASDGLATELSAVGLRIVEVLPDGNCLFRALGDQLQVRRVQERPSRRPRGQHGWHQRQCKSRVQNASRSLQSLLR